MHRPHHVKRSPIRRQSARKTRSDAVLARSRRVVAERTQGRCEARVEGVCTGRHEVDHHIRLRSQGGSHDPSNLAGICRRCHDWAHANPAEAAELGLIALTTAEPRSSAVTSVSRLPFDHRGEP